MPRSYRLSEKACDDAALYSYTLESFGEDQTEHYTQGLLDALLMTWEIMVKQSAHIPLGDRK